MQSGQEQTSSRRWKRRQRWRRTKWYEHRCYSDEMRVESNENSPSQSRFYPQICPECHYAWMEDRFHDIRRYQQTTREGSKDEDCLLWNVIGNGNFVVPERNTVRMGVEHIKFTRELWEMETCCWMPMTKRLSIEKPQIRTLNLRSRLRILRNSSKMTRGGTLFHQSGRLSTWICVELRDYFWKPSLG